MKRETLFVGAVVALLAVSLVGATVVPGAVDPVDDRVTRDYIDVADVTLRTTEVTGNTVTFDVETRLSHRGGPSEAVTIDLRAIDAESGLLEDETTVEAGTIEGDRERVFTGSLSVPRDGGYRIEAVVYRNGTRMESAAATISGVSALTPAYAKTDVAFERFGDDTLPPIEYSIASTDENQTTLRVTSMLTNTGDDSESGLELVVKARQADSNIVADEDSLDVAAIEPGRTAASTVSLSVPSGYNYYLDAVLWRDGVVVGSARSAANLNPTETISVDEQTREVGLEVGEFVREGDASRNQPETETAAAGQSTPGFGVAAAIIALLAVIAIARRNQ